MIRIKLKDPQGNWHEFEGDSKKTILEQCEEKGIPCPFACRAGACQVCACTVKGDKSHLVPEFGGDKLIEIEEDQFLTCIGSVTESAEGSDKIHEIELAFE